MHDDDDDDNRYGTVSVVLIMAIWDFISFSGGNENVYEEEGAWLSSFI